MHWHTWQSINRQCPVKGHQPSVTAVRLTNKCITICQLRENSHSLCTASALRRSREPPDQTTMQCNDLAGEGKLVQTGVFLLEEIALAERKGLKWQKKCTCIGPFVCLDKKCWRGKAFATFDVSEWNQMLPVTTHYVTSGSLVCSGAWVDAVVYLKFSIYASSYAVFDLKYGYWVWWLVCMSSWNILLKIGRV